MTVFKRTAREYSLHFDTFKKSSANRFKIGPLPNFGTLSLVLSQLLLYSPGSSIRLTVALKVPCCVSIHTIASLWHDFLTPFAHLSFCKAQFICHFGEAFLDDPLSSFLRLP